MVDFFGHSRWLLLWLSVVALWPSAAVAPPPLESLASNWLQVEDGVPDIPVDCPSISSTAGSVGSCIPHSCMGIVNYNSLTTGPYLQGPCGAALFLDGLAVDTQSHRWRAYEVLRAAEVSGQSIQSQMRMLDGGQGSAILLLNASFGWFDRGLEQTEKHKVTLRVAAEVRKFGQLPWNFDWKGGPDWRYSWVASSSTGHAPLLTISDTKSEAASGVAFLTSAGSEIVLSTSNGTVSVFGNPAWLAFAVVLASDAATAAAAAAAFSDATAFARAWARARQDWEDRWHDAFDPLAGRYSGSFPSVQLEKQAGTDIDDLEKVYYMSCLTVLACERTNLPAVAPRVYVTAFGTIDVTWGGSGMHGGAAAFFWDQSLFATLQTLLDPIWMRDYLVTVLRSGGFQSDLYVDLLDDGPGGPGGGYWYAFNIQSVFWLVEGYLGVTDDRGFLYNVSIGGRSVSELLEGLAMNWTDPRWQSAAPPLADYGGDPNRFLECIPTYVHTPAALQAQNVHMLRAVAGLRQREGNLTAASRLRALASSLAGAVNDKLYVGGKTGGYYGTVYPNGSLIEVRTCLDFMYVPLALSDDMPALQRQEMVDFFNRELRSENWMRALSTRDPIAKDTRTRRSDHGYTGAYSAWPALSAQSLALLHDGSDGVEAAAAFLRSTALQTSNGPYGQAQWLREDGEPPFKDIIPSGTRFTANCGGAFADVILRRLFGYAPTLAGGMPELWRAGASRAVLQGRLSGLRLPNGTLQDICADASGLRFCASSAKPSGSESAAVLLA